MAGENGVPPQVPMEPLIMIVRLPNGQTAVQYKVPPRTALRMLIAAVEDVRDVIHPPQEPSLIQGVRGILKPQGEG